MLDQAGVRDEDKGHGKLETWVLGAGAEVVGFFSMGMAWGIPYLVHFYVRPEDRNVTNFRRMAVAVKRLVRQRKYGEFIVNCSVKNPRLARLISRYLSAEAYGIGDGQLYFRAKV